MSGSVVHCKKDPYDVYIGRPSRWGNPFAIGRDGTREEVVAKYEEWVKTQPDLVALLPYLKGKRLGCDCTLNACHGDVLLRLANEAPDPGYFPSIQAGKQTQSSK